MAAAIAVAVAPAPAIERDIAVAQASQRPSPFHIQPVGTLKRIADTDVDGTIGIHQQRATSSLFRGLTWQGPRTTEGAMQIPYS